MMDRALGSKMTQDVAEDPVKLMYTIQTSGDFAQLIWAAGALNACLLKQAPLAAYEDAFKEFITPNSKKFLPESWVSKDMDYNAPPVDSAIIIAQRIEHLDSSGQTRTDHQAMEAAAWLLASLLELVRDSRRRDREVVRELLLADSELTARGALPMTGFRGALVNTMTAFSSDSDDITTNKDVAFINGCLLLGDLAGGDVEVSKLLQKCGLPELVCRRVDHKISITAAELWRRKLPLRWEAFATASSQMLEVLLSTVGAAAGRHSTKKQQLEMQGDAFLAVLDKSLYGKSSQFPFSCTVVQMVHTCSFTGLLYIVRVEPSVAQRMVDKKALFFCTQLLKIHGVHEEAVRLVLGYALALLSSARDRVAEAIAVGLPGAVDNVVEQYALKYPRGTVDLQAQGAKLHGLMGMTSRLSTPASPRALARPSTCPFAADRARTAARPVGNPSPRKQ